VIEDILNMEKTGHTLVAAIVNGIRDNKATKMPATSPSWPFN